MMNYWDSREVQTKKALLTKSERECLKELKLQYKKVSYKLIKDIQKLYVEINSNEDVLPSHLYQYNRYYKILANIEKQLNSLTKQNIQLIDKNLTRLYKETSKQVGEEVGFTTKIDEQLVKDTVYSYWVGDGNNWSDRVWKNKRLLISKLEQGLTDIVTTGRSQEEVVKDIMSTFSIGYNNASRIVRTELAHVQTQSTLDKYKQAGLTKYKFLATDDERACEECLALNGQVFRIEEAQYGVNLPPLHPNCRDTILGVV